MTVLLDDPLGRQSWVLLVIPVVSGAVRHGTAASVASWVAGCVGYIAAATTSAIESSSAITLLARVPGTLLAVAITVGLLARWMREGWEIQNEATLAVTVREHRLAVIERTAHALKKLSPREALELCANQSLDLGFTAVTIHPENGGAALFALGDCEIVATVPAEEQSMEHQPAGQQPAELQPTVTVWVENDEVRSHSVSVHEPQTRSTVTAWSTTPIESDQAQALATLVAHTSGAVETWTLLRQLRWTASRDALTGLANRRFLDAELQKLSAKTGRLAVAFIDADDFKAINDQHGHDVGDMALIAIARRLETATGDRGIVGRYGGDEFVILMPNAPIGEPERIAQSILDSCSEPIAVDARRLTLNVSVGIASTVTPVRADAILKAADDAVYRAKAGGKTMVVAHDLQPTQSRDPAVLPSRV